MDINYILTEHKGGKMDKSNALCDYSFFCAVFREHMTKMTRNKIWKDLTYCERRFYNMKKKIAFLLASLMMVLSVSTFQTAEVKAAVKEPAEAFRAYRSHYLYDSLKNKNAKWNYYNLDGGATEMFVKYTVGGKSVYRVYGYQAKNKKEVVKLGEFKNGINMTVKGSSLRVSYRKGTTDVTTDYRKVDNKLFQYNTWEKRTTGYFKNGKRISERTYNKEVVSKIDQYTNVFAGAKKINTNNND